MCIRDRGLVSFIYNSAVPNAQKTTILAWNAAFERDRIKELLDAQLLTSGSLEETETQKGLKKILRNLVDLREPFSYRVIYSPLLRGGSSLKTVHPYMLPLSQVHYHDLEVKNGGMAAVTYHQIEKGDMLEQQAGEKMAHLIRYCNFDSESTLQIFCKLWFLYTAKRSLFTHEELASHHEMRKQLEF